MPTVADRLHSILKKHGYSTTRQRDFVFNLLFDEEPMSINDLIKKADGEIDNVSIYRTIDLFEKIGIVQRLSVGWKNKFELTDNFGEHHHHLTCLDCGLVVPITGSELEAAINRMAVGHYFDVVQHQIELQGYCETCRAARVQ